ncbi:ferritin [Anaeroselena agilis]|uniref:Ferritin n=1 Tax=Anaeroselena agilis TaxID=3063788 RepID=A0ABU3NTF2_9FIRM|nr:ferritin [Selenomonadales bacterium 4137-cl]
MLSDKMARVLVYLIKNGLESAYFYLAASVYAEAVELEGTANWLKIQYQERFKDTLNIVDYIVKRGNTVLWRELDAPPSCFGSPAQLLAEIVEHEINMTALYNMAYDKSLCENDYRTQIFLQSLLQERTESEAQARRVFEKFEMAGNNPAAILMADHAVHEMVEHEREEKKETGENA